MDRQQIARAGELFVAAEIHRRGAYPVTFTDNMSGIDILAADLYDSRPISIQGNPKSSGMWHAHFPRDAEEGPTDLLESSFWLFVDLGTERPGRFIVPRAWDAR